MVAGPGVEPGTKAYETFMIPFQYPASNLYLAPVEGIEPPSTVLETAVMPLYHTGTDLVLREGVEPSRRDYLS